MINKWHKGLILACFVFMFSSISVFAGQKDYGYNPEAAVAYAEENWHYDNRLCDEFVKDCLAAGGVEMLAGGVGPVRNALVDAGFGTLEKLVLADDGVYIDAEQNPSTKAGDIMFFYCKDCGSNIHTAIVAGVDADGHIEAYGQHVAWDRLTYFGKLRFTTSDGKVHEENMEYYVVHMNTKRSEHQHKFEGKDSKGNNLYDNEHPHAMYVKCSCEKSYYLGWNATVSTCTVCNPPLGDCPKIIDIFYDEEAGGVRLKWSTVEATTEYEVFRADSLGIYYSLGKLNAVTMLNSSVEAGASYSYKVVAHPSGAESEAKTCTIPGVGVTKPELTVSYDESSSGVKLEWTKVTNATGYDVYRAKSLDGTYFKLGTVTGTKFTNKNVELGQTYYYKVVAMPSNVSSDIVSVTVGSPMASPEEIKIPSAVTNLKAVSAGAKRVQLTWTASENADGYLIYGQKKGKYGYVGMTSGQNKTIFMDTKALGEDYNFYWVFSYVKDSKGKMYTSGCTKYVYAKGICQAPTNFKASSVKDGVRLTWAASESAEGYLIYGIVNGKPYGYVGMTKGTTFTDKKASKDAWSFYWVFPYHNENGKMITGYIPSYVWGKSK